MIEDGVMDGVSGIFRVHVYPSIPAKTIGIRYGALTAAADDLEITIIGESGHGARPHEAVDAIWIASQVVTTLQQSISRTQNPLHPVVLTIGQISGGRAPNVIADSVQVPGHGAIAPSRYPHHLPQWIENYCRRGMPPLRSQV
jgi:amidohydrolase